MPPESPRTPLISVVIPFFNRIDWCIQAIQSVLRQTHPTFEILLVDDGSTEDILGRPEMKDPRLRYLRQENSGPAAARNLGLKHASGAYIAFLDSDDLWMPDKLEKQLAKMEANPEAWLSHTSYLRMDPDGRKLGTMESGQFAGSVFPGILLGCPIATPTVMIRREALQAGLQFMEGIAYSEDILFWSEVARRSIVLGLTEPLSMVRLEGGNAALSPRAQIQGYRNILEFGIKGNPGLDLHQRKRLASAVYTRIASVAQEGGDLPSFMAATVLAWLTPITPQGQQEAVAATLAEVLTGGPLMDQLMSALETKGSEEGPVQGLEALEDLFKRPYIAMQDEAKRRALVKVEVSQTQIQSLPSSPLISVLVPTYNQASFLPETLNSLLAQSYPHWEAVIVNDGSTDGTSEVLAKYAAEDPRFRVFHKTNGGVATALNEGIRQHCGEWICWLSSDDLFQTDKLALHVHTFKEQPDIRFFHTQFLILDDQQHAVYPPELHPRGLVPPPELQTSEFLLRNYINGISIAVHSSVFEVVGLFDDRLRNGQDFDMWMRISAKFPFHFINTSTCLLRIHPAQGTTQFPFAGIFDSGLACLAFLNTHPFEALFPLLDLAQPEQANLALRTALMHAYNPFAFVTFSGFAPALLSRIREWLTSTCPPQLRPECFRHYNTTAQAVRTSPAEDWIKRPFTQWPTDKHRHVYQPFHPRKELERQGEALRTAGNLQGAFDVARYLRKHAVALTAD